MIVELDIAQDGLLKFLSAWEAMSSYDVFGTVIKPLDHAVCLWPHWWHEAMLDTKIGAKLLELILSHGRALAQA